MLALTEIDVFKLAAVSLPKYILMQLVPTNLQSDSVDVNRMRSYYIKTMIQTWKAYGKAVIGTICPVFGIFLKDGRIFPSTDLAEAAAIAPDPEMETTNAPKLSLSLIAEEAKISELLVL